MINYRIGHGHDVHALGPGEGIVLGGCEIAHHRSIIAHSDGDVLLHAICDALLGACALGDIGQHFPDTDPQFQGASSVKLLEHCDELIKAEGYRISNIDATIQCQKPKLAPHITAMRTCIADTLNIQLNQVSVKATTTEKLGFVGEERGIAVDAVVLLVLSDQA